MPKKKKPTPPQKITMVRKVIGRGISEDVCDLGPGVFYQDEITYTNDRPGKFNETALAAQIVKDTQDLMEKLFSVEVEIQD